MPVSEAGDQRFGPVASVVNIRTMARSQAQPADGCCTAWITTGLCSPEIAANEVTLTGERAKEVRLATGDGLSRIARAVPAGADHQASRK